MDDTTKKVLRQTTMPAEVIESIEPGSRAYVGRAMGVMIAGEEVLVMARTLSGLNTVFNYLEGRKVAKAEFQASLRVTACPEIAVVAKAKVEFDDEL